MEIQSTSTTAVNSAAVEAKGKDCCMGSKPKKSFGKSRSGRTKQRNLSEAIENKVKSEFGTSGELGGKITKFIRKEIKALFAEQNANEMSQGVAGTKPYKEVIGDFIQPGEDGKIGEKELQNGLAQFSLYQTDSNALKVYQDAYESSGSVSDSLAVVRDSGLMTREDADWVNSYTRFASEFDREHVGGDLRIAVSLSNSERYDFDDATTWAEANLAHVIGGNYEVETVPVAVTDAYMDYQFQAMQPAESLDYTDFNTMQAEPTISSTDDLDEECDDEMEGL